VGGIGGALLAGRGVVTEDRRAELSAGRVGGVGGTGGADADEAADRGDRERPERLTAGGTAREGLGQLVETCCWHEVFLRDLSGEESQVSPGGLPV
jgi:hypothetical protein